MFINAATERSLDLIAQRASDVYKSFSPGAIPARDDVATDGSRAHFVLDPMSVTAPAGDYFVTAGERGTTAYTRDGRLSTRSGVIVGSDGTPMLGYTRDGATLGELHVEPVDDALGRARNMRVEPDGSVVYDRNVIEPRTGAAHQQRVCVGRLALARFPAATRLSSAGETAYAAPAGVVAHLGRPGDANFGPVVPMQREESHVDFDRSLERLHDAYVAFDALEAAHKAQGRTGKVAMDLLK